MSGETLTTQQVKCIVWDLDDTIWEGILLEGGGNSLRDGIMRVIKELDMRGILQSIASRNDHQQAMERLESFGIAEYFLYPQINFGNKSTSVRAIADELNIGIDSIAFVDDQQFERDEVASLHKEVYCIDAAEIQSIPDMPCMKPRFVTEDSAKRRQMYIEDKKRAAVEERFEGSREEFLSGLNMRFMIRHATEGDLQRAVELTERTNQLNATGRTYNYDELNALRTSANHLLYVCSLEDSYGDYGRIGLALVEKGETLWTIRLLLMSCRVMSRGVGSIMLNFIIRKALDEGKKLQADFVETGRNRMMYVTYRFGGFREIETDGKKSLLHYEEGGPYPGFPDYVEVVHDG
ncbi:MAG: HAD-IIIC family phosphatase [Candidatus Latescibacteria bacterium]|nr:HAD-IIIC family phosphatase [Candidatus Latescibacterota bacterium]